MGNSDSQPVYFGKDVPASLQEEFNSLSAVQAKMGSDEERAALTRFLENHVSPTDLEENRELCEFVALSALRFRRFDEATAAQRVTKYMEWRRKTFGSLAPQDVDAEMDIEEGDNADGKKRTTKDLLDIGVIRVLPHTTPQGQAIVFLQLRNTRPSQFYKHARQVCRAAHFRLMEAIAKFPSAQVRGMVLMVDFKGTAMENIDRKVPPKMGKLFSGILPLRMAGILICNPNILVRVVIPLAKMFMSEKLASYVHCISYQSPLQCVRHSPDFCSWYLFVYLVCARNWACSATSLSFPLDLRYNSSDACMS